MKRFPLIVIAILLLAGCVTGAGDSEPTDPLQQANKTWVQNRQVYYRNNGWSSLDAAFQAQRDLEAGKTPPEDRPPLERRARP